MRKRQLERLITKFSKQKGLPVIRLEEAQFKNREKCLRVDPRATPENIKKLLAQLKQENLRESTLSKQSLRQVDKSYLGSRSSQSLEQYEKEMAKTI